MEIEHGRLLSIQQNQTYDDSSRLSDVLQLWIDSDKDVTWEKIILVIAHPPVNNKRLANQIEQSVLTQQNVQCEYVTTGQPTLDQHQCQSINIPTSNSQQTCVAVYRQKWYHRLIDKLCCKQPPNAPMHVPQTATDTDPLNGIAGDPLNGIAGDPLNGIASDPLNGERLNGYAQCTSITSPVALTSSDTSLKLQGTNIDADIDLHVQCTCN